MNAMDASESHVCMYVCARACVYEVCARTRSRMRGETVQSKQTEFFFILPAHAFFLFLFSSPSSFMSRVSNTFFMSISSFNPLCYSELET